MSVVSTQRGWRPSYFAMTAAHARIEELEHDNEAKAGQIIALKQVIVELKVDLGRKKYRRKEART